MFAQPVTLTIPNVGNVAGNSEVVVASYDRSRHDWIVHVLAELACATYWFNPVFWIAKNRLCQESEQAAK